MLLGTAARVWWFARQDDHRVSDAIVVLGAAQFNGRPSSVFTARLVHARDLYKRKVAPRIITVGGNQAGDRFTEASPGKAWLTQHGVPAARIVAVGTGSDTLTSLRAVEQRMQQRRLVDRRDRHRPVALVAGPRDGHRPGHRRRDVARPGRGRPCGNASTEIRYIARETAGLPLLQGVQAAAADSGPNAV